MYKMLLIAGIALGPFTDWFSSFLCLVAGVALGVDYIWTRYEVQEEVTDGQEI